VDLSYGRLLMNECICHFHLINPCIIIVSMRIAYDRGKVIPASKTEPISNSNSNTAE
jgi:hypothetical protein